MTIEIIPGNGTKYYLVALDADGKERTDDPDGLMQQRILDAITIGRPTDVFTFIHGWKGDISASRSQYASWMSTVMDLTADIARANLMRPGFVPLLIGLHWPSLPFGDETLDGVASFGIDCGTDIDAQVARAAKQTADTPAACAALRTIFEVAHAQAMIPPATLPPELAEAYRAVNQEAGPHANGVKGDPGTDREPFDPGATYVQALNDPLGFDGGGWRNALLSPLVQLSFWKMKARAKCVGESGGFSLLSALMEATKDRDVRFHLMGHSFGCIVASASACGPVAATLPRPVQSLVLVQGALSLWSCSDSLPDSPDRSGYFRRLAAANVVAGPIVTTRSEHDLAVGTLYPAAAGIAREVNFAPGSFPKYGGVGAFGLQGDGLGIEDLDVEVATFDYDFRPGYVYNINCSRVICNGAPPSGAHSDIAKPEVGHLVWAAALA
jgi:hypothetical protein